VGVLALLIKLKVIKLTLWWKISPVVWMLLLFFVLFIPMQWGAPAGAVTQYQTVIEIIPNVGGQVIDVPVKPLEPIKKGDVLFRIDPETYQAAVDQLEAQLELAKIRLAQSIELAEAEAGSVYEVEKYEADVKSLSAQLRTARWNLAETDVKAPADGYIVGLTLRPGQRVSNMPLRGWMAFVDSSQSYLVAGINQNMLRHVRIGQWAEVVFKLFPGKVFPATVSGVGYVSPQGQLAPSGILPQAPTVQQLPAPYGVILSIDKKVLSQLPRQQLPGGSVGTVGIYTESVKATHIIRKVMLRMETWLNFINPY
jgi:multidrug resistance efflux pump